MHVVIAGCGRVGALLADHLGAEGHEVVIIDRQPAAFERLSSGFSGRRLQGIVFDRLVLEEAGITDADAFVAVTSGDNSNIVAARTASERFGITRVVARIYDPVRARIFDRLGITTIATTQWTAEEVLRGLRLGGEEEVTASVGPGAGDVVVVSVSVPGGVHAVPLAEIEQPGVWTAAGVTREGRTSVPGSQALLESGDLLHLAVNRDSVDDARKAVAGLGELSR